MTQAWHGVEAKGHIADTVITVAMIGSFWTT